MSRTAVIERSRSIWVFHGITRRLLNHFRRYTPRFMAWMTSPVRWLIFIAIDKYIYIQFNKYLHDVNYDIKKDHTPQRNTIVIDQKGMPRQLIWLQALNFWAHQHDSTPCVRSVIIYSCQGLFTNKDYQPAWKPTSTGISNCIHVNSAMGLLTHA